ncbi:MAG: hypothetical protein H7Z19_20170, partial [Chitinophagaceae bacterium]|nr:hypothetical protein [Rubrivivax sp.]
MSAAQWRRAMNRQGGTAPTRVPMPLPAATTPVPTENVADHWFMRLFTPRHLLVLAFVLIFPFIASPFFTFQVAAQSLVLGLVALSLTFLGGYGGMVSLAQMTVAGIAGYAVALLGSSSA